MFAILESRTGWHHDMSKSAEALKPQDVMVLAKVWLESDRGWTFAELSKALGLSASEIHGSLKRSERAHLFNHTRRRVRTHELGEFLAHGLRYVFPAEPGPLARGIPTGSSASPLADLLGPVAGPGLVWPHEPATYTGQQVIPLYRTVPEAALRDARLHELLALVDGIRLGGARERALAAEQLKIRLEAT